MFAITPAVLARHAPAFVEKLLRDAQRRLARWVPTWPPRHLFMFGGRSTLLAPGGAGTVRP